MYDRPVRQTKDVWIESLSRYVVEWSLYMSYDVHGKLEVVQAVIITIPQ